MTDTEKKTVAVAINTAWNIYNFRLGLMKALREEGYRVVAIAPEDRFAQKLREEGFAFYAVPMNNRGANPFEELATLRTFYKHYRDIAPDVVLHYTIKPNIYGTLAAHRLGIPVVSTITGLGSVFLNGGIVSMAGRLLYRVAMRYPRKVFFQNSHDRSLFVDRGYVREEKTALLPGSGIDTTVFDAPVREEHSDRFRFLYVGRLIGEKGIYDYVEAARKLKREFGDAIECMVLGGLYPGNPSAVSSEELASWREEGAITYLGERDNVIEEMAAADCVVLPSYREGMPRVLLEAASLRKPLIATDVPGCRDVVEEGINGYLTPPKQPDLLAKTMSKMATLSVSKRREMGEKGRRMVQTRFDHTIVVSAYIKAIQDILSSDEEI